MELKWILGVLLRIEGDLGVLGWFEGCREGF